MTKGLVVAAAAILVMGGGPRPASADGAGGIGGTRFMQGYAQGYEHGYVDGASAEEAEFAHHHGHRMSWMMEKDHAEQHRGCCGTGEYSSKRSFDRLTKQLGLEGEQKEKVRSVLNDEVKKVDAMYRQVRENELRQIRETQKRVGELLKGEQKEKWDAMMEKGVKKFRYYMEHAGLQEEEKGAEKGK
jgi:hypothetical protein